MSISLYFKAKRKAAALLTTEVPTEDQIAEFRERADGCYDEADYLDWMIQDATTERVAGVVVASTFPLRDGEDVFAARVGQICSFHRQPMLDKGAVQMDGQYFPSDGDIADNKRVDALAVLVGYLEARRLHRALEAAGGYSVYFG